MQISEAAGGVPAPGAEPCRFPKLEECAHFHYERVQLPKLSVTLQTNVDQSLHSQHTIDDNEIEWYMVQVTSGDECWLLQRNFENFKMLDDQLHQCIYDRKIFQLPDLAQHDNNENDVETRLKFYLERFSNIADNSLNCGPVLNWLQMDNKGHRLLVPSEESRSINTPAVAAAYSVRRYVSQARDELNLEVGDMISVIDMANPGESMWWRGKRGFQVGFFPQHCVHIIGDKVPRNMPLPPPVVGSLALTPIKPVLRKHGKLITFFRSFILNRPSRRRLKQSGILKERVFGCDLGEHLLNSGHDIPMVLKCCAEFIESHGIVDGIYRLSGVTSNIQKLRNAFDEDRIPNLYTEDILQDIHSVASLLKMYFRELPNPLCTYQLYQSFVTAVQGCNSGVRNSESDHDRLLKMREAVQKLPPPHYRTLEYLMRHLAKVAKHGTSTGMTTRNIAIVWAPNLLRCAELEVGGVAALQGVGVQAVVTEFLICYAHLIFSEHFDGDVFNKIAMSPTKIRPKSLAISTPAKLITLEEARSKHLPNNKDCGYIEVGGGPKNLPKKYHTIIELPAGRKRNHQKRSPLGWRSLFSKGRNNSQGNLAASGVITSNPGIDKAVTDSDLTEMRRKLRSVKSAESLTSGHSETVGSNEIDGLGPLCSLNKPQGHNRSVSHDSYFDIIQTSQNSSLLDLSEIQLNFELEESEMRIFSEDESLVSSPRINKDQNQRRILTRTGSSAANSSNPSPKKQARVVISPDSMSRKRTRLEDQLSDIQFIDCTTPENIPISVEVHSEPKNKSPRNSDPIERAFNLQKSYTDFDICTKFDSPTSSPVYQTLETSSDYSPVEIVYQNLSPEKKVGNYENILTTISITYKSPPRSLESSPIKTHSDNVYENVIVNVEKAVIPTSTASLPSQEATQPAHNNRTEDSISYNSSDIQFTPSEGVEIEPLTPTDLSISEIVAEEELISEEEEVESFPMSYEKQDSSPNVSPDLIEFSPTEVDDSVIYQQVKCLKNSINEVNALLQEEEKPTEEDTFDSLEEKISVKDLTNRFEDKIPRMKRDGLPPCLRARNLKNQLKTRSLDEDEFNKECKDSYLRRKSMDEGIGYKTNSLPKILNQPKAVPNDIKIDLHCSHTTAPPAISTDNINLSEEEIKKRERIEKYKEERRKYFNDKFRTESFREDKDVILSKLKIFTNKPRDDKEVTLRCKSSDFRSKAAVFETSNHQRNSNDFNKNNRSDHDDDFIKKRHTFDTHTRKEISSPSYCIKDMKAIFESKSKQ